MEKVSDSFPAIANEAGGPSEIAQRPPSLAVHLTLAGCSAALLAFCLFSTTPGASITGIPLLETSLLLAGPLLVPAAYWHQHRNFDRRDAALMLPWTFVVAALISQTALIASTYTYPLRDMLWRRLDEDLGISLPAIVAFAARHPLIANFLGRSYGMVHAMVLCAILLPLIFGRRVAAERFLLANALGFVLALPCMVFLPAVGPWVAWGFEPNQAQSVCGSVISLLRQGSISGSALFGATVCLPSFHVFWAVVSAVALQSFRLLRIPAAVLAVLIAISTMTTGWHYGVDVIGGILLAGICVGIAIAIVPREKNPASSALKR